MTLRELLELIDQVTRKRQDIEEEYHSGNSDYANLLENELGRFLDQEIK